MGESVTDQKRALRAARRGSSPEHCQVTTDYAGGRLWAHSSCIKPEPRLIHSSVITELEWTSPLRGELEARLEFLVSLGIPALFCAEQSQ